LQDLAERIRRQPQRDPAVPVQVPGDPEKAFQADREANGIPIAGKDLSELEGVARELGIEPLRGAS
jgi:LDH2 family malate/lactate/ureidoglycolate dehydrogenase